MSRNTTLSKQDQTIALAMLDNLKTNGFNGDPKINNGLGGLWINWRTDTQPLQENLNGSGEADDPDDDTAARHDSLTDLRYLHNLLLYKALYPHDTQFDAEATKFTAIVSQEFGTSPNERGWVYDELIDIYRLSKLDAFKDAALLMVTNYAKQAQSSPSGIVVKTSDTHPNGYYRVDLALQNGAALVEAGAEFQHPEWVTLGNKIINFVYDHAYVAHYHTLLYQMDEVLLPDGSVNPDETVYRDTYGHTKIEGSNVRVGSTAQEALSLLHAGQLSHDQRLLDRANDLLTPLTDITSVLGLWDTIHGGYFASMHFTGDSLKSIGSPTGLSTKKESGRQIQILEAFHVSNALTGNRFAAMESQMHDILVNKAYYAPGKGVLYEMTADWQPVAIKTGGYEDWVTAEAMGIALESLFSLAMVNPW